VNPAPVVLQGQLVRLEPLERRHAADLLLAAADPDIWLYLPLPQPRSPAQIEELIAEARRDAAKGEQIPFAVVDRTRGRAIGSTRYLEIRPADRALEIGWTWYAKEAQRTAVNTECKFLLLRHAFEALGALRMQFKTDRRNLRSQRAIERIGAVKEGVFRKQRIMPDGYVRDTVYYSILDAEWPAVKARLREFLSPLMSDRT
jgi:RimJ/RimL family protein N-acetyltransferase